MSEFRAAVLESAIRAFHGAPGVARPFGEWAEVADSGGFSALLVAPAHGGIGGDWGDAVALARFSGRCALAFPLAEPVVAGRFASEVSGLCTVAPRAEGAVLSGRFSGAVTGAAWGRSAAWVLAPLRGDTVLLRVQDAQSVSAAVNPADEARDVLEFEAAACVLREGDGAALFAAMALMRAGQIAGALEGALALSTEYANTRVQFGRPIGKFQAAQQSLALFAEEAEAAAAAAAAAARAADVGFFDFEIASAKLRANRAAEAGAIAHQMHGAIGFTREHSLNHFTRRLIAWRSEFGGDAFWAERVGRTACAWGGGYWSAITARGDAYARD